MTTQTEISTLAVKVGEISGQMRELEMLPYSPVANVIGMRRRNPKLASKLRAPQFRGSDLQYVRLTQAGARRFCAPRGAQAPLSSSVGIIYRLGAPKKMSRVAAWRIIAPMQRAVTFVGAGCPRKGKRHVRSLDNALCGQPKMPVPARATARQPGPAVVWSATANLTPKAIFRAVRNVVYSEQSHGALLSHNGQDRAAFERCSGPHFLSDSRYVRNCGGAL